MRNFTCFLIDDDTDDQEFFELALGQLGLPVTFVTANNGVEGLGKLVNESFTPDYIFIDLNMPLMDGKHCLKEIRKIGRLSVTPIIIYSTSREQKDMLEAQLSHADSYLVKPTQIEVLKQKLEEIFSYSPS